MCPLVNFKSLKARRLSELIEDSIKELILTGQLVPGNKLPPEKEISRQFGVSIVTVREALRGLECFGYIEKKRGREGGIFIAQTDNHAVKNTLLSFLTSKKFSARDLGQVRRIIQPASTAIAARNISPDELKQLEDCIKYCERKLEKCGDILSEKEFFDIEERNIEFHRLIAEATHNPILILTVDYVEDFLLSFKKSVLVPDADFTREGVEAHRKIYDLLKNGDAEAAEREMNKHVIWVEDYLSEKDSDD